MYNKNIGTDICEEKVRTSIYLEIIGQCRQEVDEIRGRVHIITCSQLEVAQTETPDRTELESQLKALLSKIVSLKNDIVS